MPEHHTVENNPVPPEACAIEAAQDSFVDSDGITLSAYAWTAPAAEQATGAVVVLMHGYGEYAGRYDHFARYLVTQGHPVHAFDLRGHGASEGKRGDVADLAQYVAELSSFVARVQARRASRRLVLLGHSMGGLLALRLVERGDVRLAGLVLSSPMVALCPRHRPLPLWLARLIARSPLAQVSLPNGLDVRDLTHDSALAEAWKRHPMNHGRTTPRWYASALTTMEQAQADATRVTLPVLTVQSALDPIVDARAVERTAQGFASADKEFLLWPGALHELLNETDCELAYERIGSWLHARD